MHREAQRNRFENPPDCQLDPDYLFDPRVQCGKTQADIYQYKDKNGNWVLTDSREMSKRSNREDKEDHLQGLLGSEISKGI